MAELITKSACEIVSLLKAGEISIEDTLVALAERIEQVDTEINALPTLCFERAREAARQDDRRGTVLAGIPVAIKDLTDVGGVRTTYGSTLYQDHVRHVRRLLQLFLSEKILPPGYGKNLARLLL